MQIDVDDVVALSRRILIFIDRFDWDIYRDAEGSRVGQ